MSQLLRCFPPRGLDVASAEGIWLTTQDGHRVMDLGGASHGTALLGHAHPDVVAAFDASTVHVTANIDHPARTRMLEALHALLPEGLDTTFMANSGAEAVECALKLAICQGRHHIVAIEGGFHGRTMGALAVTSNPTYRQPFSGRLAPTRFIRPDRIDDLESAIDSRTAAIILEPILGEGGIIPLSNEFLQTARRLCDAHGVLLIADEVQTGFRTGAPLASVAAGITPDIVCLGKGLAGGLPIGLTVTRADIAQRMPSGGHGTTYGGAPIVASAAAATLQVLASTTAQARRIEQRFRQAIDTLSHPAIESVRGLGAMLAINLRTRSQGVLQAWQSEGVAALPAGPRAIRILPPLTITDDEIDQAVAALGRALPGP